MQTIFVLGVGALLGLIPATIASRKGRSFFGWWVYGTLLFLIALIHSLVIREDTWSEPAQVVRRSCPACGKSNDASATFCRHCGKEIGSGAGREA